VYDRDIIQKVAERRYSEARALVVRWTLLGALLSGALCAVLGPVLGAAMGGGARGGLEGFLCVGGAGALLGGIVGYLYGQEKALEIRFQAQMALCQLEIERHLAALRGERA